MLVSINQPAYLPWLGYFARIATSDVHVVLDHVQFEKNSFTNRNKVRTGKTATWLTVPVKTRGKFGALPINTLEIDANQTKWRRKHWATLQQNYQKAPFWADHAPFLEHLYAQDWRSLARLCRAFDTYFLETLQINTHLVYSSQLDLTSTKSDLILDICKAVGAEHYLSGALGRDYLDQSKFETEGVQVSYQDYNHPVYTQLTHQDFMPYMSLIDLLVNHGPESRPILLTGN